MYTSTQIIAYSAFQVDHGLITTMCWNTGDESVMVRPRNDMPVSGFGCENLRFSKVFRVLEFSLQNEKTDDVEATIPSTRCPVLQQDAFRVGDRVNLSWFSRSHVQTSDLVIPAFLPTIRAFLY